MQCTWASVGAIWGQVVGFWLHLARAMCPRGAWEAYRCGQVVEFGMHLSRNWGICGAGEGRDPRSGRG